MIVADLTRNPKQEAYFLRVLEAAYGDNPYRFLFFGGDIRGGKTFGILATLVILCKIFPGSKWFVIRKSMPRLQETSIPSMEKLLGPAPRVRWSRSTTNYFVEFNSTGSRIYFAGEDFANDPKLDWMLGLECNGIFLEQMEELQKLTLDMAKSRVGSWIIPPDFNDPQKVTMPTGLILGSFNKTMTWVKDEIIDPWRNNTLEAPYHFEEAKASDNPWNTQEQWNAWSHLPDDLYNRFVGDNWDLGKPNNLFAYSFSDRPAVLDAQGRMAIGPNGKPLGGHHRDVGYNQDLGPLYLSFDFNVEPITCLASQHDPYFSRFIHVVKEYRLLVSDIWALTEHIIANVPQAFFMVTGDASGNARSAIIRDNKNYYQIIRQQMVLSKQQIKVPKANPSLRNTRVLCNALLQKHGNYWVNTQACPYLTMDLNKVEWRKNKIDEGKDKHMGHLLAAWRYYNWTWHRNFLDKSLYQYSETD